MRKRPIERTWYMNTCANRGWRKIWKGMLAVLGVAAVFVLWCAFAVAIHQPLLVFFGLFPYLFGLFWVCDRMFYQYEPAYWQLGRTKARAWHMSWWRSVRYSDILAVEESDEGATVVTAKRRVPLGEHTMNWRDLAQQLRRRAGLELAAEPEDTSVDVTIPPETVSAWLGVAPGETLRIQGHIELYTAATFALVFGILGLQALANGHIASMMGGIVGGGVAGFFVSRIMRSQDARVRAIRASGEALEVKSEKGWRKIAWGSIRSVTPMTWKTTQITTTSGDIILGPWIDQRRIMPAVNRAIEARQAGEVLPRMAGEALPEGAISPAVEGEVDQAAISRSES